MTTLTSGRARQSRSNTFTELRVGVLKKRKEQTESGPEQPGNLRATEYSEFAQVAHTVPNHSFRHCACKLEDSLPTGTV